MNKNLVQNYFKEYLKSKKRRRRLWYRNNADGNTEQI